MAAYMNGYMSGASTEPELKMISAPRRSSTEDQGTSTISFPAKKEEES